MSKLLAIGVDGARGGWVAVSCFAEAPAESHARRTEVALCATFEDLVALRGDHQVLVAVDIPIGLLDTVEVRPCDEQARELLGSRRSTVFAPPSRPLLAAAGYAQARAKVAELRKTDPAAKSLSAQAFALAPKIKEVDNWLRDDPGAQEWLFECHPELSFRAIADGRVLAGKKTPHGQIDRLRLIQQKFSDAVDVIAETRLTAKKAELADILDAYAAAHSALRVAVCNNEKLGGETDNAGIIMRMVF